MQIALSNIILLLQYAIHTVSPMIILIQGKYFVLCSFGFRLTISGMNV